MAGLGALGGSGLIAGKSLAVLGAGLLSGAVAGSALVATGTVEFGGSADRPTASAGAGLQLVPCPDQGPVLGSIPRDQQVLVTARSADGAWLQLYWPAPGIERAWTKAGPLAPRGGCLVAARRRMRGACQADAATDGGADARRRRPHALAARRPRSRRHAPRQAHPEAERRAEAVRADRLDEPSATTRRLLRRRPEVGHVLDRRLGQRRVGQRDALLPAAGRPPLPHETDDPVRREVRRDAEHHRRQPEVGGPAQLLRRRQGQERRAKTTRTPPSGALAMTVKVCKNTGPKFTTLTATPDLDHHRPPGGRLLGLDAHLVPGARHRRRRRQEHPALLPEARRVGLLEPLLQQGRHHLVHLHQHRQQRRQHRPLRDDQLVRGRHRRQGSDDEDAGQDDHRQALRHERASTTLGRPRRRQQVATLRRRVDQHHLRSMYAPRRASSERRL